MHALALGDGQTAPAPPGIKTLEARRGKAITALVRDKAFGFLVREPG